MATIHAAHPRIRAQDWRSPLVCRVGGSTKYLCGQKTVSDSYRSPSATEVGATVDLAWGEDLRADFLQYVNTYQAHVVTEHAALGLACILLHQRAALEITEVTRRGDKADYWLGNRELMLEVSGENGGGLAALCVAKSLQLRANPFRKDGYVCVADFGTLRARLWFFAYAAASP